MTNSRFFIYLLVMAAVTYLIRALPLVLIRHKIENRFIASFLYYVPYAVLGCMTFPAIFYSTNDLYSAAVGTFPSFLFAYQKKSLLFVAVSAVLAALIVKVIL